MAAAPAPTPAPAAAPAATPTPAPALAAVPRAVREQFAIKILIAPKPTATLIAPTPSGGHRTAGAGASARGRDRLRKPPMNVVPVATATPRGREFRGEPARRRRGPALRAGAAAGNPAAEYEIGARFAKGAARRLTSNARPSGSSAPPTRASRPRSIASARSTRRARASGRTSTKRASSASPPPSKGTPRRCTTSRCSTPRASTGKPDYRTASQWFRKAADQGIVDSQYNLGILYARGIGVEPNLAESYKWFALASRAGRPGRRQEARRCRRQASTSSRWPPPSCRGPDVRTGLAARTRR